MTEVIVYTKEGCGPCSAVKRWLDNKKIVYTEYGPSEAIASGFRSVPVLKYKNETVFGFNPKELEKAFQ